jgi:hypothetical protein
MITMQHLLYTILIACCLGISSPTGNPAGTTIRQKDVPRSRDLTISYDIRVVGRRKSSGIGETYNGGVKTLFIKDGAARVRLVSLMRMQDVFVHQRASSDKRIALVRESGKNKYVSFLTREAWAKYNAKYAGLTCHFSMDTVILLKQVCKKALLRLKDGKTITAYYSEQPGRSEISEIEPAFACIPGLVLKYEYKSKKGTVVYTATSISRDPIDPSALVVPQTGYSNKKYSAPAS